MKKQRGFSLIELLIVVAIILIIAAIAIPNLLKSRIAANESSAVGTLRTYNTAFVTYSAQCPALGFPKDLPTIGPGIGDCTAANIVDNIIGVTGAVKSGYTFVYTPAAAINGVIFTYGTTATPATVGTTGQRMFCSDQTGVIRYDPSGAGCGGGSLALQ